MPQNPRIDVYGNGDFQRNPQQVTTQQPNNTQVGRGSLNLSTQNIVSLALLANTAKNVGNIGLGRIGELTGNMQIEKGIDFVGGALTTLIAVSFSPGLAILNTVVQGISKVSDRFFESRKANTEARFYRRLQMGTTDNSRGKGGKV
jgi:hypothetical protein